LPDYVNSSAAGADGSDIGAVELQTSPGGGDVTPAASGPTGQRAAAKKHCKKKFKHNKKKRKKCLKRAKRLPV
jgi:hypothetical protein